MLGAPRLRDGSWVHGGVWRLLAWSPPLLVVLAALRYGTGWPAPVRLAVTTLVLYAALKATAILRQSPGELLRASPAGRLVYLTVWPGMSLAPFQVRGPLHAEGRGWLRLFDDPLASRSLTESGVGVGIWRSSRWTGCCLSRCCAGSAQWDR
jgi:hypothetical protein